MSSREQFEAWVAGRKVVKKHGAKLNMASDGTYCDYRINDRWLAWQASRMVPVTDANGDQFELGQWWLAELDNASVTRPASADLVRACRVAGNLARAVLSEIDR